MATMAGTAVSPGTLSWESAERALTVAQELAQARGVTLERRVAVGRPEEVIVSLARAQGSDLIVVGRRGLGLPERVMMGSVTARIIGLSPVDVLVVPRHTRLALETLLVATDGSRYSRQAAWRAIQLAQVAGGFLHVLTVLDIPPGFEQEAPEVAAALRSGLEKLVAEVTGQAEDLKVKARGWVRQGPAYQEVVKLAQELPAHLLIMGSHGRTGLKRLLMGSVTERVIGHAPCPVLVVKKGSGSR